MSNSLLRRVIGTDNYMNTLGYLVRLYKSVFLRIREPGVDLVAHFLPKGGIAFDIGANIGRFTTYAATLVGSEGRVYSFEPLAYPRRILRDIVKLRRLKQVDVVGVALSSTRGEVTMNIPLKADGKPQTSLAYISESPGDNVVRERVTVETLDGFYAARGLERVDLIKCDVEGLEYKVLLGGLQTLQRHHPTIYCEIDPAFHARQGTEPSEVFDLLSELGFRAYLPDAGGCLAAVEDWLSFGDKRDYFFIHESKHLPGVTVARDTD